MPRAGMEHLQLLYEGCSQGLSVLEGFCCQRSRKSIAGIPENIANTLSVSQTCAEHEEDFDQGLMCTTTLYITREP